MFCFSVHSARSLNVGHTDSHGSVLSTTAFITTPRAHFQSVTAPEKRVNRAMDPKRNSIGSICYLGYICSGLVRAVRDPYHSGAGLVFAVCRNWAVAVGDGYFSERGSRSSASLGFCSRCFSRRIHCSGFGRSAAEGEEAVGWVGGGERKREGARLNGVEGGGALEQHIRVLPPYFLSLERHLHH